MSDLPGYPWSSMTENLPFDQANLVRQSIVNLGGNLIAIQQATEATRKVLMESKLSGSERNTQMALMAELARAAEISVGGNPEAPPVENNQLEDSRAGVIALAEAAEAAGNEAEGERLRKIVMDVDQQNAEFEEAGAAAVAANNEAMEAQANRIREQQDDMKAEWIAQEVTKLVSINMTPEDAQADAEAQAASMRWPT